MSNWLFVASILVVVGCGSDPTKTTDTDTDTETQPTPTDTGEDTTGEPVYETLSGEVTYDLEIDGEVVCHTVLSLTGTRYEDPCPSCLFAFDVSATEVESVGGCGLDPIATWTETDYYTNPVLAFSEEYASFAPKYTLQTDVLWSGHTLDLSNYGGKPGTETSWSEVADSASSGTAYFENSAPVWDGAKLQWSSTVDQPDYYAQNPLLGEYCYDVPYQAGGYATEPFAGQTLQEAIGVAYPVTNLDVFEFAATAGDTVGISVDTVRPADAFTPYFNVVGPDGCLVAGAAGTFLCAFNDPNADGYDTYCPALELDVQATGTYRVVVSGYSAYDFYEADQVTVGAYELGIAHSAGSPASVLADDTGWSIGPMSYIATTTLDVDVAP